jgi:hypothetical protein
VLAVGLLVAPDDPGRVRWVVERSVHWLLRFNRLGLRYDRTQRTLRPLLTLGCVLINLGRLVRKEFREQVLRPSYPERPRPANDSWIAVGRLVRE